MIDLINFCPNMKMPQKYIDVLIEVAKENNLTAEEFSRNIITSFLARTHREKLLDSTE